jgi:hypothetical protein
MKRNGLGKLYDRLTPEERFRLDVEAMARGDAEESRRLVDTCPRLGYTMTDLAFSKRWDGALQITMATLMDLRQNTTKLRMIAAFRVALPYSQTLAQNDAAEAYLKGHEAGSRHAWSKAGMESEPPGYEPDEEAEENADPQMGEDLEMIEARVDGSASLIPGLLDRLERELATEAFAVWEAFCGFCEEEMDLSAERLLQATFDPALEDVRWFADLCERLELESDQATVEECREALLEHWERPLDVCCQVHAHNSLMRL